MRTLLLALVAAVGLAFAQPEEDIDPEADAAVAAEIASAPGLSEPPLLDPPDAETAESRTERISSGLRCPVCQGLSVADSNADAARAMHTRIAELVSQGYSEDQIVDYFVGRYGAWVRLEPPREGLNWIIWVGPVVLFVVGAGVVARQIGGRSEGDAPAAAAPSAPPAPAPAPAGDADYRAKVLAELGEESAAAPAADPRARILAELGEDGEGTS
jgi:cytochrome c-type biogenesis protein CcmH